MMAELPPAGASRSRAASPDLSAHVPLGSSGHGRRPAAHERPGGDRHERDVLKEDPPGQLLLQVSAEAATIQDREAAGERLEGEPPPQTRPELFERMAATMKAVPSLLVEESVSSHGPARASLCDLDAPAPLFVFVAVDT